MKIWVIAATSVTMLAANAAGQSLTDPPTIVQLVRKPGIGGASRKPYGPAGASVNVIGMAAVTGLPETWLVECHYSFASVEEMDQRIAAVAPVRPSTDASDPSQDDVLAPTRTILAAFRPGWSYRADQAIRMFPRARYFQVSIFRIRPGAEADFGELVRLRRATADVVNLDRPELAYQVFSGAPSGTILFLAPLTNLRNFDDGVNPVPVFAEGLAAARAKDGSKIAADTEISREHLIFRVEPRISYVSSEFADVDPEFWRGKRQ
ncbi:MAG: hypothetical protein JWP63_5591 [Candidatus Solibacter sp.]|nr:hypothetical protein [Candidatus Solibacter sp.]